MCCSHGETVGCLCAVLPRTYRPLHVFAVSISELFRLKNKLKRVARQHGGVSPEEWNKAFRKLGLKDKKFNKGFYKLFDDDGGSLSLSLFVTPVCAALHSGSSREREVKSLV